MRMTKLGVVMTVILFVVVQAAAARPAPFRVAIPLIIKSSLPAPTTTPTPPAPTTTPTPPAPTTTPTPAVLPAPTGLAAHSVTDASVELIWTYPDGGTQRPTGFYLEQRIDGVFSIVRSVDADLRGLVLRDLLPSSQYTFRLVAFNATGRSAPGNVIEIATPPPPLAAPSDLHADILADGSVLLTWRDNSPDENRFDIIVAPAFAEPRVLRSVATGVTSTSIARRALPVGSWYAFRVAAVRPDTPAAASSSVAVDFNALQAAPKPPAAFQADALSPTSVRLTWEDQAFNERGFTLQYWRTGDLAATVTIDQINRESHTLQGLTAGAEYHFRLHAFNDYGQSVWVSTRLAAAPPAAPSHLTAEGTRHDEIELRWRDNATNELDFVVDRSADDGATWVNEYGSLAGQSYAFDIDIPATTRFCYRIKARNGSGMSAPSNVACASTLPPPAMPAAPDQLAAAAVDASTVGLSWSDRSDNERGFTIEVSVAGGAFGAAIQPIQMAPNATSVTITQLAPGTNYAFRIRAFNDHGASDWSATANAVTPGGAASGVRITNTGSYAIVSLVIDGMERLGQGQSVAPGSSYLVPLAPGQHTLRAATGFWNGSLRDELWYYPGAGPHPFTVGANSVQTFTIGDIPLTQLLANPRGGRTNGSVWQAQTGIYQYACFIFYPNGTYQFKVSGGSYGPVAPYVEVGRANGYVAFRPAGGFPTGSLNELIVADAFANPTFFMDNGPNGTELMYEYRTSNTCAG